MLKAGCLLIPKIQYTYGHRVLIPLTTRWTYTEAEHSHFVSKDMTVIDTMMSPVYFVSWLMGPNNDAIVIHPLGLSLVEVDAYYKHFHRCDCMR